MDPIPSPLCGLLNLNKPSGMTSRQAVNVVQRLARPAKTGHAGTLDPLATGVLVVCVGATRLIEYVQRMPKHYVGTFLLGRQSATEDVEGDVTELPHAPRPTREEIETAAQRFFGWIQQRPPTFSALKVQGRPAYKLARRGKPVELAPRPVQIHRIELRAYQYPELILEIECGGGTYVRSLGRDLAESLGTAAVMSALMRTRIGRFSIDDAVDPRELTPDNWIAFLQPPLRAVEYLPRVRLSAQQATDLRNGLTLELRDEGKGAEDEGRGTGVPLAASPECEELAAVDPAGHLVGILTPAGDGKWRTLRNLPTGA